MYNKSATAALHAARTLPASVALLITACEVRAQDTSIPLPEIRVIGTSPISSPTYSIPTTPAPPGPGTSAPVPRADITAIDRDKVPASTQTLLPQDFDHARSSSVSDSLQQNVTSVFLSDTAVNPFQPDLVYRGFVASPTLGTPQGLAIYQNGVRVNEVFGDTVNWDFVPEYAVARLDVVPNNPVYGLNALGGALSIRMKDGFTYSGAEAEVMGGSFGRRALTMQVGKQYGNVATYIAGDALNDNGWRDRSESKLRRLYADIGVRGENSEFHLSYTGAANSFGAAAATPVEMLNRRWSSIYTTPQTYQNQLNFITASASYDINERHNLKSLVYYRGFRQKRVDGNTSEVEECADPNFLCLDEPDNPLLGPVPTGVLNGLTAGSIDRTRTKADAYGGSTQLTSTHQLFGHNNQFVAGTSIDRGKVNFGASSELGTIGPDLFVTGTGVIITSADGVVAPVSVLTTNTYTGLYATNTFDVTSRLSITAGGRFNHVSVRLDDRLGTALNGAHEFHRFNPVAGLTYKITPAVTGYAGYSESNRVPTPSELACADPNRPCLLDNFLVSDPPLKQVVGKTWEAGLRGRHGFGRGNALSWTVGLFRTESRDDIMAVPSEITGRGLFQNVGTTLRQGLEASANLRFDQWTLRVGYTFLDATFQDTITLASPDNPLAVDGEITVRPGHRIPSIPRHRFNVAADYAVTDKWKVGGNLIAASGQYLRGDESNLNPMLPGYWIVNLNTIYQINKRVQAFGLVKNVFNQRYYTFGTFFDTDEVPFLNLSDPRTLSPGAPLAAYAGLRVKFFD